MYVELQVIYGFINHISPSYCTCDRGITAIKQRYLLFYPSHFGQFIVRYYIYVYLDDDLSPATHECHNCILLNVVS